MDVGKGKVILIFSTIFIILFSGCFQNVKENGEDSIVEEGESNLMVVKVIDGDTLMLSNGETVRLIGIDAPERGEKCYKEAKEKLGEMALWKEGELESDVEAKDRYGRSLYYVYIDGNFVNLKMVRQGYSFKFEYPPNIRYAEQISEAESKARDSNSGCLWS